jgi:hypothetical protein
MTKAMVPGSWSHSSKSSHNVGGRSDGSEKTHPVQWADAIRPDNWIVRSFTDKSNRSNSIEHQLSVVK